MMSTQQHRRIARRACKRDPKCPRTHTGRLVDRMVAISGGRPCFSAEYMVQEGDGWCLLQVPLYVGAGPRRGNKTLLWRDGAWVEPT
jgi:hypothetical protein